MKKLFFKTSLLVLASFMFYSCSSDNDVLIDQNQENISHREGNGGGGPNVFTDAGDGQDPGGGGGGAPCNTTEYSTLTGDSNSGTIIGRIFPNISQPFAFTLPYYVDYTIAYQRNSQGNIIITKTISRPLKNCSGFFDQKVTSNTSTVNYIGAHIRLDVNFTVMYNVTSSGAEGGSTPHYIHYFGGKTFALPLP